MSKTINNLIRQKLFQLLLVSLVVVALVIGVVIVPVEWREKGALITNTETGIWWAVTTLTGVGFGDVYPITLTGRILGMLLELIGVVAFGLLVALIAVAIAKKEDRFYWSRLFERLTEMEGKLEKMEKKEEFSIKNSVK